MLSLYEILKASKTGIAPDMWTALAGMNWSGAGSGAETKEITGIPPLNIRSNGTMLLDYLISGNTAQNGTPTPTTPIQPQECGEMTGNLIDIYANNTSNGYVNNALLRSDNSTYTPSSAYISEYLPIEDNKTYTYYTGGITGEAQAMCFYNAAKKYISGISYNNQTAITFTTPQGTKYYRCTVMRLASNTESYKKTMLNSGTTALPYEPYGYKIPISSASTTTPIYLGEVPTTRKIRKYEFTGNETFFASSQTSVYYTTQISADCNKTSTYNKGCIVNAYKIRKQSTAANLLDGEFTTDANGYLWFRNYDCATLADFKAYLAAQYAAGTPVCVWYVLATPETAVVNEPLRKIGDYADTLSYEQAGVQIPTNRGNTVIDVETTLKPSQMYIKYQE